MVDPWTIDDGMYDDGKTTNPLEGFGVISQQQWDNLTAEVERLKEQIARTERERDQAIDVGGIQVVERGHIVSCTNCIYNKDVVENINDLYLHLTHLAGKVEGWKPKGGSD